MDKLRKNSESCFKIFPNNNIGIDVTSGSLGHGLGIAAGISIGEKNKNIWTIISEGELYEGSIWESLLFIKYNKLYNIKIILDKMI